MQYHLINILLCSSFVKYFGMLFKQKLYQRMLSFLLNFQMAVLFTSNSHHHYNVKLSTILSLLY